MMFNQTHLAWKTAVDASCPQLWSGVPIRGRNTSVTCSKTCPLSIKHFLSFPPLFSFQLSRVPRLQTTVRSIQALLNCSCFMTNSFTDLEVIKALPTSATSLAWNSPPLELFSTFNSTSSPEKGQHNGADISEVHMQRYPKARSLLTYTLLLKCGSLG